MKRFRCFTLCLLFHFKAGSQDAKRKAVAGVLGGEAGEGGDSRQQEEEEKRIKAIMKKMSTTGVDEVCRELVDCCTRLSGVGIV